MNMYMYDIWAGFGRVAYLTVRAVVGGKISRGMSHKQANNFWLLFKWRWATNGIIDSIDVPKKAKKVFGTDADEEKHSMGTVCMCEDKVLKLNLCKGQAWSDADEYNA